MDCSRARTHDPDAWLAAAPEFSRPLCAAVREWIFRWEPDLVESIKWNLLAFTGRKLVCGLSACKKHLGISFFRGTELPDPAQLFAGGEGNTNIRTVRIASLDALDREAFRELIHAAVALDARPDIPPAPKVQREPWPVPDFFAQALKKNRAAASGFAKLSMSSQREYLVWVSGAKREETRARRVAETLAAVSAGRKWANRHGA
jgi:hypothetical protein